MSRLAATSCAVIVILIQPVYYFLFWSVPIPVLFIFYFGVFLFLFCAVYFIGLREFFYHVSLFLNIICLCKGDKVVSILTVKRKIIQNGAAK